MLMPRRKTPDLVLETIDGAGFDLSKDIGSRGVVICFYRGLHCPICANYLKEFEKQLDAFANHGVTGIAISSDGRERTEEMVKAVGAEKLRFAYDLPLAKAREWGLYISTGRGKTSIGIEEPELFSEPGLFMVGPDQALYYGSVQTMPFVRPHFSELASALDFAIAKNYPARGEYDGPV